MQGRVFFKNSEFKQSMTSNRSTTSQFGIHFRRKYPIINNNRHKEQCNMRKLLEKIRKILKDRRTRQLLTRTVSVTAAIVVFVSQLQLLNSKDSEITRSSSSVVPGGIILAPRTFDTTFQRNQHMRIPVTSKRNDTAWRCVQTVICVSCDGFLESGLLNSI